MSSLSLFLIQVLLWQVDTDAQSSAGAAIAHADLGAGFAAHW